MEGLRRALPVDPGEWRRLVGSVVSGLDPHTGGRLREALRPATTPQRGLRWLSPRLVFVRVRQVDVAVLGETARALGAQLLPGSPADSPVATEGLSTLVRDMALVHGLLDLDPGEDGEVLRYWGADGPLVVIPPPVALAAHRRLAARVHTLWEAGGHT